MKTLLLAIALTTSAAAIAQTESLTTSEPPLATEVAPAPEAMAAPLPSTGSVQAPGNTNPERDARGIVVISDAAIIPAGYNGTPSASGMGGPLTDPATGEALNATDASHPPCSRTVTDNCLQTYERGRSPQ